MAGAENQNTQYFIWFAVLCIKFITGFQLLPGPWFICDATLKILNICMLKWHSSLHWLFWCIHMYNIITLNHNLKKTIHINILFCYIDTRTAEVYVMVKIYIFYIAVHVLYLVAKLFWVVHFIELNFKGYISIVQKWWSIGECNLSCHAMGTWRIIFPIM